jgi:hypothetical protein
VDWQKSSGNLSSHVFGKEHMVLGEQQSQMPGLFAHTFQFPLKEGFYEKLPSPYSVVYGGIWW